ncbi:MAG: DegT/DnrJ/EryC1/StrS aminotransferase family protein [Alphaproteobacteria bacterium]|nr:DegT/DnrJ/EryC1/StrS aminotransferase family protein [Alphaproteobacteria bacterium]
MPEASLKSVALDPSPQPIAFIDLDAQRRRIGARMEEAILRVVRHGQYILGPEVKTLEGQLSAFCGARHVITCASGTDALVLALMAKGVGRGHAVLCPSFTFAATAEAVVLVGATPVFVDVLDETFCMDPAGLEAGLAAARKSGLAPVAAIAVDLFGQPADYEALSAAAKAHGLWILADAAQSFGASYQGQSVGTLGEIATTSFFPAKPLGCYGDGGAIFTADDGLAEAIRSLRMHGQGTDKYDNVRIGTNSRLDTIQAAVLIEKLSVFANEINMRDAAARRYAELLAGHVRVPIVPRGLTSVWAQYTIRVPAGQRASIVSSLKNDGVPTAIYYPRPLHRQTAYRGYPVADHGLPVSERLAGEVLSLPMHADLSPDLQGRIAASLQRALKR